MSGALQGVKVLEIGSYVTGPYAGMLLGDLGAEVIKVEIKPYGDPFRGWGRTVLNPTFCSLNRNKKSITLNLKTVEAQGIFLELADGADVIIENLRTGAVDGLGIGYETVRARNSRIVYCSISGFGSEGPYVQLPAYDTIGQAMGGLLSLLTDLDDPKPMGISLADHLTGIFACYGILAALHGRMITGEGHVAPAVRRLLRAGKCRQLLRGIAGTAPGHAAPGAASPLLRRWRRSSLRHPSLLAGEVLGGVNRRGGPSGDAR